MTDRDARAEGARLIRQRAEMGGGEVFLDGLTREQALAFAEAAKVSAAAPGPASDGVPRTPPAPSEMPGQASPSPQRPNGRPRSSASTASARARPLSTPKPILALPSDYGALKEMALGCTRCRLSETRTQVVFSDGVENARLMVIGEAPGANEDETGLPFVGAAGKYLDLLLSTVNLSRADTVYIANVLKCRPPANRNPQADEIEACSPFLRKQIELIRPRVVLALGMFSAQLLTERNDVSLGKLRGTVHSYEGVPLVVTYHPAALLRNPKWTRAFWEDLQLLRSLIDGAQ